LWGKFHPEIPDRLPLSRASNKGGVGKQAIFLKFVIISKTVQVSPTLMFSDE